MQATHLRSIYDRRQQPPVATIIIGSDYRTAVVRSQDGTIQVIAWHEPFPELRSRTG